MGNLSLTSGQILWGLNSFLFMICFFFIKVWINSLGKTIDKMESRLNLKLDIITCEERNHDMKATCADLKKHTHAPTTTNGGGQVIL